MPSPAATEVERFQVLDQLTLLVDKSLVVAESTGGRMRTGCWKPMRQYALEKLGESGEADTVRDPPPRPLHRAGSRSSTLRRQPAISSVSTRPKPRSTTCGRHSRGVAKTPTSSCACSSRHRCSRCGSPGAACAKGWPGSTRHWPTSTPSTVEVAPAVLARTLADAALLDGWVGVPERHGAGHRSAGDRSPTRRPIPVGARPHRVLRYRPPSTPT